MKTSIFAIIVVSQAIAAPNLFAQGTVLFNNRNWYISHVWGTTGTTSLRGNGPNDNPAGATPYTGMMLIGTAGGSFAAATTFAALLGAPGTVADDSTMQAGILGAGGLTTTTFRTGLAAGNIVAATATFDNIAKDAPVATFEMVAWDNSSGLYPTWNLAEVAWSAGLIAAGKSDLFQFSLGIGGEWNTPPVWGQITPGQSTTFNLYMIPEPTSIALIGCGAALAILRRRKS